MPAEKGKPTHASPTQKWPTFWRRFFFMNAPFMGHFVDTRRWGEGGTLHFFQTLLLTLLEAQISKAPHWKLVKERTRADMTFAPREEECEEEGEEEEPIAEWKREEEEEERSPGREARNCAAIRNCRQTSPAKNLPLWRRPRARTGTYREVASSRTERLPIPFADGIPSLMKVPPVHTTNHRRHRQLSVVARGALCLALSPRRRRLFLFYKAPSTDYLRTPFLPPPLPFLRHFPRNFLRLRKGSCRPLSPPPTLK